MPWFSYLLSTYDPTLSDCYHKELRALIDSSKLYKIEISLNKSILNHLFCNNEHYYFKRFYILLTFLYLYFCSYITVRKPTDLQIIGRCICSAVDVLWFKIDNLLLVSLLINGTSCYSVIFNGQEARRQEHCNFIEFINKT